MSLKEIRSSIKISVPFSVMLVFGFMLNAKIGLADISVDSYCRLTIESMQQEVSNMQELIAIISQYKDDPLTLTQQIETKRAQFDQARAALYSSFGIDADEYISFMSRNNKQVNTYLDANPDIQQQINELSVQLNELMAQEQAVMGSAEPAAPAGQ